MCKETVELIAIDVQRLLIWFQVRLWELLENISNGVSTSTLYIGKEVLYLEEFGSGTVIKGTVGYFGLLRQVLDILDPVATAVITNECGHVRCVRSCDDQCKEIPCTCDPSRTVTPENLNTFDIGT